MRKKILLAGDSFAADWSIKYKNAVGWVNMLKNDYNVKNIAEAGVSEYKIYLQLKNINLAEFDNIVVSHTSAYRIPIKEHPIHKHDKLHKNCDLIYSDVIEHLENPTMKVANDFYEQIFNPDYFVFVNTLIYNEIRKMCKNAIHITFFDSFYDNIIKLEDIFIENRGETNHLNEYGNMVVYEKIKELLK